MKAPGAAPGVSPRDTSGRSLPLDLPRTTLAGMINRALLVVGCLLAIPAGSQELATPSLLATPQNFDLRAESVQKIVRDTAATQYAAPQLDQSKPVEQPKDEKAVRFVPPEKAPARNTGKLSLPNMPKAIEESLLSHVITSLIDEALGIDQDDPVDSNSISWLGCQSRIDLKRETLGNGSCNH